MSDQEVKGKKSGRGRGRGKGSISSSSSSSSTSTAKTTGNKKTASKKKTTIRGLKVGRGRGRIRIEDSSSDEEEVPRDEPDAESPPKAEEPTVVVKQEPLTSPVKIADENYLNTIIREERLVLTETNHVPLLHTFQSPSLPFKDDLDDDITPTLSFVGPRINIPLHNNKPLTWNHKVNLIGDKCPSPRIHICDRCERPILLYGRLIPCKHIFCYDCAKANPVCLRCNDKVARVEKNKLGAVFMCSYENCRRTYLSHRDLQAHISHRHLRRSSNFNLSNQLSATKQPSHLLPTTQNNSFTITSPSTSLASSSLKTNLFLSSRSTHIPSRATSNSTIHAEEQVTGVNDHRNHRIKLPNSKNFILSGKSSNPASSLANLPRNSWTIAGQPSSTTSSASSSSFTSPTLPSSLSTSSWNLPLLSDPRHSSMINRHLYP